MICPVCGQEGRVTRTWASAYYFHADRTNACIVDYPALAEAPRDVQQAERMEQDGDTTALRRLWDAEIRQEMAAIHQAPPLEEA
jgi:hypothetical protein